MKIKKLIYSLIFLQLFIGSCFAKVLVIAPQQKKYSIFVEKLLSKRTEIKYQKKILDKNIPYKEFKNIIKQAGQLSGVVVVDNYFLKLLKKYNSENAPVKGVSVLALNLEKELTNQSNIAGIRYEPSIFSMFSSFRYTINSKAKNLITIYRSDALADQISRANKELNFIGANLIAIDTKAMRGNSFKERLKLAVDSLEDYKFDALWVPLDSVVLSPDYFRSIWIPLARKLDKPILVQTESLASKKLDFASFAVAPSIHDLANQAHQLIKMITLKGIAPENIGVEESISVKKFINKNKLNKLNLEIENKDEDIILIRN